MNPLRIRTWNDCWKYCVATLRALWLHQSLQLRPAPEALTVPLRPSPRLRVARRLFLCMTVLYVSELLLRHHWLAAPGVALLLLLGAHPGRIRHPRCLQLDREGSLWLQWHSGRWEQLRLHPASLRLGAHVLLVLRGSSGVQRVLLGPDNLAPDALAALQRRLRPGSIGRASGLHSVAAPGSQSSNLP